MWDYLHDREDVVLGVRLQFLLNVSLLRGSNHFCSGVCQVNVKISRNENAMHSLKSPLDCF